MITITVTHDNTNQINKDKKNNGHNNHNNNNSHHAQDKGIVASIYILSFLPSRVVDSAGALERSRASDLCHWLKGSDVEFRAEVYTHPEVDRVCVI